MKHRLQGDKKILARLNLDKAKFLPVIPFILLIYECKTSVHILLCKKEARQEK
jgi:hypothetical protein